MEEGRVLCCLVSSCTLAQTPSTEAGDPLAATVGAPHAAMWTSTASCANIADSSAILKNQGEQVTQGGATAGRPPPPPHPPPPPSHPPRSTCHRRCRCSPRAGRPHQPGAEATAERPRGTRSPPHATHRCRGQLMHRAPRFGHVCWAACHCAQQAYPHTTSEQVARIRSLPNF